MTPQAFKEAEFESSSLRIVPVAPKAVSRFEDLPNLSYSFEHGGEKFINHYSIEIKDQAPKHIHSGFVRGVAKQFVNATFGAGIHLLNSTAYYPGTFEFYVQTLQNIARMVGTEDPENTRGDRAAAIHGHGNVFVPLPRGASLTISDVDQLSQMRAAGPHERWDIILKGDMVWFGQRKKWFVAHAHCQGFEFTKIIDFTEQLQETCLKWFPFLEGHICFDNVRTVSNPVSHQGLEVRDRG